MTVATVTVVILTMAEGETDPGRPMDLVRVQSPVLTHTNSDLMSAVTPSIHQLFCMLCYPTFLQLSRHSTVDTAVQPQCVEDTGVQM